MTLKERRLYAAQGMPVEMINELGRMEDAQERKNLRERRYMEENHITEVSWEEYEDACTNSAELICCGESLYYKMTPEDIYILKESLRETNERLYAAVKKLKESDATFILTLFFKMDGSAAAYSKKFSKSREAVRDRKIRVLKKLRNLF